jgi:hypothetical protein
MAPLIVLFELSILLARWIGRVKPVSDRSTRWDDTDDIDYDEVQAAPSLDEEDDLPLGDVDSAVPVEEAHDDDDDEDGGDPSKLGDPDRKD